MWWLDVVCKMMKIVSHYHHTTMTAAIVITNINHYHHHHCLQLVIDEVLLVSDLQLPNMLLRYSALSFLIQSPMSFAGCRLSNCRVAFCETHVAHLCETDIVFSIYLDFSLFPVHVCHT